MQIHNFLCDLLASTRILIDTYMFPHHPGFVKSYEFNLGNRTFQLGAEPVSAYALPAVIVNIQDESINFGGRRSDLIQRNGLENINKIPVLYNEATGVSVHVHEEQTVVPFSISFNCESQMQAKEIAFTIKQILPLYKNINLFRFTTFLEIDQNILFNVLNYNILLDQIVNLYTKLNHNTGNIEYCFSLEHKPLIRLDSISTTISDSSQSTFQTQLELVYVIPFPQYLLIDEYHVIESINFNFNIGQWPIVTLPFFKQTANTTQKVDRTLVIDSETTYVPSGVIISKTETQVHISIQFETTDLIIAKDEKYKFRFRKINHNVRDAVDLVPTFTYAADNKVVFILTLDEYAVIEPTSAEPLFIDFYYDL